MRVAVGRDGGGAGHERVAELRDAHRVLEVGQRVSRVPARLAEVGLQHGAVVAGEIVGEAEARREVLGVCDRAGFHGALSHERLIPGVVPVGEGRNAVRGEFLFRPFVLVHLEARADVHRQTVREFPVVLRPHRLVVHVVDAGDRRVVEVDLRRRDHAVHVRGVAIPDVERLVAEQAAAVALDVDADLEVVAAGPAVLEV